MSQPSAVRLISTPTETRDVKLSLCSLPAEIDNFQILPEGYSGLHPLLEWFSTTQLSLPILGRNF